METNLKSQPKGFSPGPRCIEFWGRLGSKEKTPGFPPGRKGAPRQPFFPQNLPIHPKGSSKFFVSRSVRKKTNFYGKGGYNTFFFITPRGGVRGFKKFLPPMFFSPKGPEKNGGEARSKKILGGWNERGYREGSGFSSSARVHDPNAPFSHPLLGRALFGPFPSRAFIQKVRVKRLKKSTPLGSPLAF